MTSNNDERHIAAGQHGAGCGACGDGCKDRAWCRLAEESPKPSGDEVDTTCGKSAGTTCANAYCVACTRMKPAGAVPDANEREILKVIDERDHREAIIDQILDAVLGSDRPEWSSAYGYEDAVIDVIDKLPPTQAIQPAADGDMVLIERGLIGAACSAIDKKRDAPALLEKLRAVTFEKAAVRADAVPAAGLVDAIIAAFPLFDDVGLNEKDNCCEWSLQQDRKRLHAMLRKSAPQQMTTHGEDTARLDWLVESWGNDLGPLHRAVVEAFRKSDAHAAREAIDAARLTESQP